RPCASCDPPHGPPRSTPLATVQPAPQGLELPAEALIFGLEFLLHGPGGLELRGPAPFGSFRAPSLPMGAAHLPPRAVDPPLGAVFLPLGAAPFLFGALPCQFPLLLRSQELSASSGVPES